MGKDLNRKGFALLQKFSLLIVASHNDQLGSYYPVQVKLGYQIRGGKFGPYAAVGELLFEGEI